MLCWVRRSAQMVEDEVGTIAVSAIAYRRWHVVVVVQQYVSVEFSGDSELLVAAGDRDYPSACSL